MAHSPTKPSYVFHWVVFAALVAAPTACYFWRARPKTPAAPPPAFSNTPVEEVRVNGFLVLKMPEISAQHESGIEVMRVRLDQWLEALLNAGFHPMRLSEALQRAGRQDLPERTVVLVFSPGYRRTYEIVAPILARRGCSAVWLTNEAAMKRSDRRYLTYHATRQMKASGRWDVGFAGPDGAFRLEKSGGAWSSAAGALAMNRESSAPLNFLTVNSDWMGRELVERLWAETPPTGPVHLTKAVIHARDWGVARPGLSAEEARFDLRTPPSKRGTKLFWLGTLGQPHFQLRLEAASLTGELWLQLRFDEASGDDLHLIVSGGTLVVEERQANRFKRLLVIAHHRSFQGRPFTLDAILLGERLSLSIDHQPPRVIDRLTPPAARKGMVQLYLSDKVRGAAKVDSLRITFAPLTAPAAATVSSPL